MEGKKKGAKKRRVRGAMYYRVKQIAPNKGRAIKAARDVHARDRHVFHPILFKQGKASLSLRGPIAFIFAPQ